MFLYAHIYILVDQSGQGVQKSGAFVPFGIKPSQRQVKSFTFEGGWAIMMAILPNPRQTEGPSYE